MKLMKLLVLGFFLAAGASASAAFRTEEVALPSSGIIFQVDSSIVSELPTVVYSKTFQIDDDGNWVFSRGLIESIYEEGWILLTSRIAYDRIELLIESLGHTVQERTPEEREHPVHGQFMIFDFADSFSLRDRLEFFALLLADPEIEAAEFTVLESLDGGPNETDRFVYSPFLRSDLFAEGLSRETFFGWVSEKYYPWIWDHTRSRWFYVDDSPSWQIGNNERRVLNLNLELYLWDATDQRWLYYNAAFAPWIFDLKTMGWFFKALE
jgi:hypothetical protein